MTKAPPLHPETSGQTSSQSAHNLADRDDEAGAQDAYANALPDGITSRIVREYTVGPYRYTDLTQAIAERDRQLQSSRD